MNDPGIPSFPHDDSGPLVGVSRDNPDLGVHLNEPAPGRNLIALGRSGVGKSTLIGHILSHKLDRKAAGRDDDAIVVVDLHGDLVPNVLRMVPPSVAGRVRLLDFAGPDRVPALNLLDPSIFPDRGSCVEQILSTLRHSWDSWGSRMEEVARSAFMSFYDFNSHPDTIRSEMLTLLDLPLFLETGLYVGSGAGARAEMTRFQRHVMARVGDPGLRAWLVDLLNLPSYTRLEVMAPLVSRLNAHTSHSRASLALWQRESLLDFAGTLRDGGILLVSAGAGFLGRVPASLLGSAVISAVESALLGQLSSWGDGDRRCLLACEDFGMIPGTDWVRLLSDSRGLGMSLLLSSPSIQGWEERSSWILGGFGSIAAFQVSPPDALAVSAEMGLEGGSDRLLSGQHSFECLLRVHPPSGVGPVLPVSLFPPRPPVPGFQESRDAVLSASLSSTVDVPEARRRIDQELDARPP